jgi:hypothetical protein
LDKCDREEQLWTQAYAGKVINLAELKGCRAEIAARRESIFTQRQQLQTKLDTIGLAVEHGEALIGYCARVRQKVQTFGAAEQRLAIEALNVRVTWTPEAPLAIEGTIPFDEIVPLPLECEDCLGVLERMDDDTGQYRADPMELVLEGGDDAKVSAATPQAPEEVCVISGTGRKQLAIGRDEINRQKVIGGQAVRPRQIAPAAAKTGLERRRSRLASSLSARIIGAICRAASRSVVSAFIFNAWPPNKRVLLGLTLCAQYKLSGPHPPNAYLCGASRLRRTPSISVPWRQQAISPGVLCAILAPKSVETAHIHLHNFRCRISSGTWASQIFRVRNRRTNRPEYRQSFRS